MKWIAIVSLAVLFACNNKSDTETTGKDTAATTDQPSVPDRSLMGTWKPVRVEIPDVSDEERRMLMDSTLITFGNGGKATVKTGSSTKEGSFLYSEQDSKLSVTHEKGTDRYDISWESDLLRMSNEKGAVFLQRQ
jgi:hypothetical protein